MLGDGGRAVILEFSIPEQPLLRRLYMRYFEVIMPRLATLVSRDRTGAYRYLPQSVVSFQGHAAVRSLLRSAGFAEVTVHPRSFGIVALYVATKCVATRRAVRQPDEGIHG